MISEIQTRPTATPLQSTNHSPSAGVSCEGLHSALKPSTSSSALYSAQVSITLGKRGRDERGKTERDARTETSRSSAVKRVRISDVASVRTIDPPVDVMSTKLWAPVSAPAPVKTEDVPATTSKQRLRSPTPASDYDDEPLGPPSWGLTPIPLLVPPHSSVKTPSALALAPELHQLAYEPEAESLRSKSTDARIGPGCRRGEASESFGYSNNIWRSSRNFAASLQQPVLSTLRPAKWDTVESKVDEEK